MTDNPDPNEGCGESKRRAFLIEFQGDLDPDTCTSDVALIIDMALDKYFGNVRDFEGELGCRVFETLDAKELDACLQMIRDHSGIFVLEDE